jgi:hypothetical protein
LIFPRISVKSFFSDDFLNGVRLVSRWKFKTTDEATFFARELPEYAGMLFLTRSHPSEIHSSFLRNDKKSARSSQI